jgi:hypothetical protein
LEGRHHLRRRLPSRRHVFESRRNLLEPNRRLRPFWREMARLVRGARAAALLLAGLAIATMHITAALVSSAGHGALWNPSRIAEPVLHTMSAEPPLPGVVRHRCPGSAWDPHQQLRRRLQAPWHLQRGAGQVGSRAARAAHALASSHTWSCDSSWSCARSCSCAPGCCAGATAPATGLARIARSRSTPTPSAASTGSSRESATSGARKCASTPATGAAPASLASATASRVRPLARRRARLPEGGSASPWPGAQRPEAVTRPLTAPAGHWGTDCSLSFDSSGRVALLAGSGYKPGARRPLVYVYELPPRFNVWWAPARGRCITVLGPACTIQMMPCSANALPSPSYHPWPQVAPPAPGPPPLLLHLAAAAELGPPHGGPGRGRLLLRAGVGAAAQLL